MNAILTVAAIVLAALAVLFVLAQIVKLVAPLIFIAGLFVLIYYLYGQHSKRKD